MLPPLVNYLLWVVRLLVSPPQLALTPLQALQQQADHLSYQLFQVLPLPKLLKLFTPPQLVTLLQPQVLIPFYPPQLVVIPPSVLRLLVYFLRSSPFGKLGFDLFEPVVMAFSLCFMSMVRLPVSMALLSRARHFLMSQGF